MKSFLSCLCFLWTVSCFAQTPVEYKDKVYVDYIKSVQFRLINAPLSKPIINLNSQSRLELIFDDLSNETREFRYDLIHCDKNWNKSDIDFMDYLEGFNLEEIEQLDYSINTLVDYTQYRLLLPNEDLRWTISGNYILVVYDEDEDTPVITRRFLVVDNKISFEVEYVRPSDISKFDSHQEFDFKVNYQNLDLNDPLSNVTAVVLQNFRWDNAKFDLNPKFINRNHLVYNYNDVICFPGLKEFRNIDTRSLYSTRWGVKEIDLNPDENVILLEPQKSAVNRRYLTSHDANGDFLMYTMDKRDSLLSAEYATVIFALESAKLENDVHILGHFNDFEPKEENRMFYDESYESYIGEMVMKQGYYDYMFGLKEEDGVNFQKLQGSWYESENDYYILIYYTSLFERYDQLMGIKIFNSNDF